MATYFGNTLYAPVMLILMFAKLKTLSDHYVCVITRFKLWRSALQNKVCVYGLWSQNNNFLPIQEQPVDSFSGDSLCRKN